MIKHEPHGRPLIGSTVRLVFAIVSAALLRAYIAKNAILFELILYTFRPSAKVVTHQGWTV